MIESAIDFALRTGYMWGFIAEGVTLQVASDSRVDALYRAWRLALKGCGRSAITVGPHPQLSESSVRQERALRSSTQRMQPPRFEYTDAVRAIFQRIQHAPRLELRDVAYWNEWTGANDSAPRVVGFTDVWARLMQLDMARRITLEDCWWPTHGETRRLFEVDEAAVNTAKQILYHCWQYGFTLRRCAN